MKQLQQTNQTDKIMIRRSDGTFAVLEVEDKNGSKTATKNSIQGSQSTSVSAPSVGSIKDKDFFSEKKHKSNKFAQKPIKSDKGRISAEEKIFTWEESVSEVLKALPSDWQDMLKKKNRDWVERLKRIILSRLQDIRDWLTTKEALTKDWDLGGLGLNEATVAELLNAIESQYKKIHSKPITKVKESPSPFGSDVTDLYRSPETLSALVEADVMSSDIDGYKEILASHLGLKKDSSPAVSKTKELKELSKQSSSDIKSSVVESEEIAPVKKIMPKAVEAERKDSDTETPIVSKKDFSEKEPFSAGGIKMAKKTAVDASLSSVSVRKKPYSPGLRTSNPNKPVLEDVRYQKRLVGPIDELKNMRLLDFRRLGSDTDERLDRIFDKISALEDESFQKKVEGIRAWRQSPLYQKYLAVGNESLEKNLSVEQVINNNLEKSSDELTLEEFNKISDFNKKLRY